MLLPTLRTLKGRFIPVILWLLGLAPVLAADPPAIQGELLAKEGRREGVQFTGPVTNWVSAEVGLRLANRRCWKTGAGGQKLIHAASLPGYAGRWG